MLMLELVKLRNWPWLRLGRWLGGVLLGSYVLYVSLAWAFLSFGGLAWATENETDARVAVTSGYSLLPGRVHLRGLKVQVRDYNIEMDIRADSAQVSLALRKLLFKQLDVSWVRVRGVEYRLVHRVVDPITNAARLAAFPEILGSTRPNHYDAPKAEAVPGKLWTVRFADIDAELRLAWVLEYQVRGKMSARGGFFLDPSREAHVFPCRVEVDNAEIFVGEQRIAEGVQGTLSARVEPFDPRDAETLDVIPRMSAAIERFSAELDTLQFTELYLRPDRVAWSGRGRVELDLRMVRGQLQDGSTAGIQLTPITVRAGAVSARGTGAIDLRAGTAGRLDTQASFSFPAEQKGAFSLASSELGAVFEHEVITDLVLRSARLEAERIKFDGPDFLTGLLGETPAVPMSGEFDASLSLDLPQQGSSSLDAKMAARRVSFYRSGLRFGLTADGLVHCSGTRSESECKIDFHAPYVLFDQQPSKGGATLWLRAKTQHPLRVSLEQGTAAGRVQVVGSDPKTVVSDLIGEDWIVQLGLTLVPTGPLAGTIDIDRKPDALSLRGDVSAGSTGVQGYLHTHEVISGAWVVDMPTHRWGFKLNPDGISPFPLVDSEWLANH